MGESVSAMIGGHRHGAGEREGELGEQRARQAALKADRNVDGEQHHGHGDDGAGQFARRLHRRGRAAACRLPSAD